MKTYSVILFLTIISMFTRCDNLIDPAEEFALGDTLFIDYKETFYNADNDISVTFDSLISDSRCPIDVICVWAGNAEVKFKFMAENVNSDLYLNTHPSLNTDTLISEYKIYLLDVLPHKLSDSTYQLKDHSVKIFIEDQRQL